MEFFQTQFKMRKRVNQTEAGKAFEYACAYVLFENYSKVTEVNLMPSPQLDTAKNAFEGFSDSEKKNYIDGAKAAVKIINRLEPKLSQTTSTMNITLQTDKSGARGDVRDVVCVRGDEWEVGISCKHNNDAVKHSRLSDSIDFGKDWFGKECSSTYLEEVKKIFAPLREIRDRTKAEGSPALWSSMKNKEEECYIPVLDAFMKELKSLNELYPKEIPAELVRYLMGRNDFYKVIMNDKKRFTQVESVNMNGTLNKPDGKNKALIEVPLMKLPTKFYEIGYKDGSQNTILVVCDNGWNVSMRIHNASSRIEPSLKFDVQLTAMPSSILTQIEPWD